MLTVFMESDQYGRETFTYPTIDEALAGIRRLYESAEAQSAKDGVTRRIGLLPNDPTTPPSDDWYRQQAEEQHGHEGEVEVDPGAPVSRTDNGAYVQAWIWVYNPEPDDADDDYCPPDPPPLPRPVAAGTMPATRPTVRIEVSGGRAHYTATGDVDVTVLDRDTSEFDVGNHVTFNLHDNKGTGEAIVLRAEINEDDDGWRYLLGVIRGSIGSDIEPWASHYEIDTMPGIIHRASDEAEARRMVTDLRTRYLPSKARSVMRKMPKDEQYKQWYARHELWQADCLREFNEKYGESRRYYCLPDEYPDDYEPGQLVEFAEDGDAYPHGAGGTNWIPKAVTPWRDSPHFTE
jgi:hypothetical protein